MKIILVLAMLLALSSCASLTGSQTKKSDNNAAMNKYENKMRSIASSGNGQLQLPEGYKIYKADLIVVGPEADVILFYKDGNEIVIKECERYSIINNRSDCRSNMPEKRVLVSDFKNKLKLALRVSNFDTLGQKEVEQLKNYREGLNQSPSAEDLIQQRDEAQNKVSQIEAFIQTYGVENANANELSNLKARLVTLNAKVQDGQKFSDAVEALNASINKLVDDVIGTKQTDGQMPTLSYSKDKTGIEYSVLRTYVRPYLAQAVYVPVKAGTFKMGSPSSEEDRDNDEVRHQVTLTKDFEIGATEVTQLQWVVIMGSNPSRFQNESDCPESYMEHDGVSLCYDFPVEQVSWNDVKDYIREYNNRAKDNFTYRLPTEAEWEFAARGGTTTAYSFGNSRSELTDYAWFYDNSKGQARTVATRKANPLEIHDIHGNVWEWVGDWYGDYTNSSVTNPTGPRSGSIRVLRGGSWNDSARFLRSANRYDAWLGFRWSGVGFRLVRTPK